MGIFKAEEFCKDFFGRWSWCKNKDRERWPILPSMARRSLQQLRATPHYPSALVPGSWARHPSFRLRGSRLCLRSEKSKTDRFRGIPAAGADGATKGCLRATVEG